MVDEILRRLVKSVNTELEIKCKEATRAYFNLLHWNFPAGMKKNHENFRSACSTFYGVRATLAKFGPYAGNMKFNMHNEEWMYMYNSTCVSFHISTAKKYTSNNRKFLSKNAIHNKGKTVAVIFTKWIRNVICVSTTFYLGFDRERVEKVPPPPHFKCLNGQHLSGVAVLRSKLEFTVSRIDTRHIVPQYVILYL